MPRVFKDSSKIFINIKTDSLERFTLRNMVFRDTARVYFQANSKKAYAPNINIDFKRMEDVIPYSLPLPVAQYISVKRTANDAIQFYNNDVSDKLRMIVIGFTHNGTPVYLNQEVSL